MDLLFQYIAEEFTGSDISDLELGKRLVELKLLSLDAFKSKFPENETNRDVSTLADVLASEESEASVVSSESENENERADLKQDTSKDKTVHKERNKGREKNKKQERKRVEKEREKKEKERKEKERKQLKQEREKRKEKNHAAKLQKAKSRWVVSSYFSSLNTYG